MLMALDVVLYALGLMIFYDFSLHALELFLGRGRASQIKYYWPTFETNGQFDRQKYTVFWTAYWGMAFILAIAYLLSR